jgi:hypothetical protein
MKADIDSKVRWQKRFFDNEDSQSNELSIRCEKSERYGGAQIVAATIV